jgi:2-methylcitrate dehydratase PrpD
MRTSVDNPVKKKESESVTLLSLFAALAAAVLAKLCHIEYFQALSITVVFVFTGYAFRESETRPSRRREIAGLWMSGVIIYFAARWIFK